MNEIRQAFYKIERMKILNDKLDEFINILLKCHSVYLRRNFKGEEEILYRIGAPIDKIQMITDEENIIWNLSLSKLFPNYNLNFTPPIKPSHTLLDHVISKLKIIMGLDITQKRIIQNTNYTNNSNITNFFTMPELKGESAVLISNNSSYNKDKLYELINQYELVKFGNNNFHLQKGINIIVSKENIFSVILNEISRRGVLIISLYPKNTLKGEWLMLTLDKSHGIDLKTTLDTARNIEADLIVLSSDYVIKYGNILWNNIDENQTIFINSSENKSMKIYKDFIKINKKNIPLYIRKIK